VPGIYGIAPWMNLESTPDYSCLYNLFKHQQCRSICCTLHHPASPCIASWIRDDPLEHIAGWAEFPPIHPHILISTELPLGWFWWQLLRYVHVCPLYSL